MLVTLRHDTWTVLNMFFPKGSHADELCATIPLYKKVLDQCLIDEFKSLHILTIHTLINTYRVWL